MPITAWGETRASQKLWKRQHPSRIESAAARFKNVENERSKYESKAYLIAWRGGNARGLCASAAGHAATTAFPRPGPGAPQPAASGRGVAGCSPDAWRLVLSSGSRWWIERAFRTGWSRTSLHHTLRPVAPDSVVHQGDGCGPDDHSYILWRAKPASVVSGHGFWLRSGQTARHRPFIGQHRI